MAFEITPLDKKLVFNLKLGPYRGDDLRRFGEIEQRVAVGWMKCNEIHQKYRSLLTEAHHSLCLAILAQVSRRVTVRLKTSLPWAESALSTQKYPSRSN